MLENYCLLTGLVTEACCGVTRDEIVLKTTAGIEPKHRTVAVWRLTSVLLKPAPAALGSRVEGEGVAYWTVDCKIKA